MATVSLNYDEIKSHLSIPGLHSNVNNCSIVRVTTAQSVVLVLTLNATEKVRYCGRVFTVG